MVFKPFEGSTAKVFCPRFLRKMFIVSNYTRGEVVLVFLYFPVSGVCHLKILSRKGCFDILDKTVTYKSLRLLKKMGGPKKLF